jgi:hypothetical protein
MFPAEFPRTFANCMTKRKYLLLSAERAACELAVLAVQLGAADNADNDDDDDNDLLLCCLALELSAVFPRPRINVRHKARIDSLTTHDSIVHYRFTPSHIRLLLHLLDIPAVIVCGHQGHGHLCGGEEGLLLLLRRLTYPCRWSELVLEFGLHIEVMSELFGFMVNHVVGRFGHLLDNLALWEPQLPAFAALIANKGAPASLRVFGFIDGTLRGICRPSRGQRAQYSGHKRRHGLKFQIVSLPNGLIAHLHGPQDGRRHDITLLRESNVLDQLNALQAITQLRFGEQFTIYGDSAYPINNCVITGFRGADLNEEEHDFNKTMSTVRESVEWAFGKVATYFAYVDFAKNQKALLQPVALYYRAAALLTNCHTCLYGSVTTCYFDAYPPSLEKYLSGDME